MKQRIDEHQGVQKLLWEVQEVFIYCLRNKKTAEETIQILKVLFDSREDHELSKKFWAKYADK